MCSLRLYSPQAGGITSQIAVGIPSQQVREQIISNSRRIYLRQLEKILSPTTGGINIIPNSQTNTISDGAREQTFSNSRRTLSDS